MSARVLVVEDEEDVRGLLLELLGRAGRAEAVATFLALLELLRLGEVDARQEGLFGDIVVMGAAA